MKTITLDLERLPRSLVERLASLNEAERARLAASWLADGASRYEEDAAAEREWWSSLSPEEQAQKQQTLWQSLADSRAGRVVSAAGMLAGLRSHYGGEGKYGTAAEVK